MATGGARPVEEWTRNEVRSSNGTIAPIEVSIGKLTTLAIQSFRPGCVAISFITNEFTAVDEFALCAIMRSLQQDRLPFLRESRDFGFAQIGRASCRERV